VIAYPTKAVYGIGCDPESLLAIELLLQIKQREKRKGSILVAADFALLEAFSPVRRKLLHRAVLVFPKQL